MCLENLLVPAPVGATVRRWIGPTIAAAARLRGVVTDAEAAIGLGGRRATPLSLGIDIGGTFTDIVVVDHATGDRFSRKQLTATDDPAAGVIAAIDNLLAETGIAPAAIGRVVHATTLFTNALIERKGAKTGLITTEGFRDILEIGRERKYDLYDVNFAKPEPLVPRQVKFQIRRGWRFALACAEDTQCRPPRSHWPPPPWTSKDGSTRRHCACTSTA